MKLRVLKTILPAFAVLLAVGLAFATESTTVYRSGHYLHPNLGWQTVPVSNECVESGEIPCKFGIYQVYSEPSLESAPLGRN